MLDGESIRFPEMSPYVGAVTALVVTSRRGSCVGAGLVPGCPSTQHSEHAVPHPLICCDSTNVRRGVGMSRLPRNPVAFAPCALTSPTPAVDTPGLHCMRQTCKTHTYRMVRLWDAPFRAVRLFGLTSSSRQLSPVRKDYLQLIWRVGSHRAFQVGSKNVGFLLPRMNFCRFSSLARRCFGTPRGVLRETRSLFGRHQQRLWKYLQRVSCTPRNVFPGYPQQTFG